MKSNKNEKTIQTEKKDKKKNSKNLYLYIALSIILILILGIIIFAINNKEKEEEKLDEHEETVEDKITSNTSAGIVEDKEYEGLKFTNTSLISSNNSSVLSTNVENLTDSDIDVRIFDIVVKDSTGNMMVTMKGYVGGIVPANTSRDIISNVDMNLSTATEVEYVLVN